ncbi:hypothetical protein A8C32_06085 [Flavivirga aquatica]|uniref:Uncharacterized protein n=1 Tax=Flavivirga aquatica TaxID=1849968 RepID=A0A1E5SI21_9FLAO|nr:hypothetical protein A8C32_06085 [Flavivirga aquatica]
MYKSKVFVGLVVLLYVLFVVFEFIGYEDVALFIESLIVPLMFLVYVFFVNNKNKLFLLFLLCYSFSDFLALIIHCGFYKESSFFYRFHYHIGNLLYIFAYSFLFIDVAKSLSLSYVFKNLKFHIVVLAFLNAYVVYVLQFIVSKHIEFGIEYCLELFYNIIMLLLLSLGLLNYFYKDNKKSLYLFLGVLCIVFSEFIALGYIYIAKRFLLSFLSVMISLIAFYFLFEQSKFQNKFKPFQDINKT